MECLKRGVSFLLIDDPSKSSASRIAAGIINPITGRKFVKTWMYEALEEAFIPGYKAFEDLLAKKYLVEKEIIRAFPKISDQNNWDARSLSEDAGPFMQSDYDFTDFENKVKLKIGYGKVHGYQLKVSELLEDFKNYLINKGAYREMSFDHAEVDLEENSITYRDIHADHIIFCEGYKAIENPYFNQLPFALAKGELLIVEIPGLESDKILKDGVFLVQLEKDIFWAGATYAWDDLNERPSEEKKVTLLKTLDKVLDIPYKVIDHKAGVRPSTDQRRPFMGSHPTHKYIHIFNGLGTKGSSLGPYWADHFMNYLEKDSALDKEVDISIFLG